MRRNGRSPFAPLAAALVSAGMLAAAPVPLPDGLRLVSSAPEDEYSPAISPDGKWIAYVSRESGDAELMAQRLDTGFVDTPRPVSPSPAEDTDPVFSPDGKWLAWISTREDAFGDVLVARFPDGKPAVLGARGVRDTRPRWITEGRSLWLVFDSEDFDGAQLSWRARAGSWKPEGTPPVLGRAPVLPFGGVFAGEGWLPESTVWAARFDDTDGDGLVGEGDDAAVWTLEGGTWRQLTEPAPGLADPHGSASSLAFSAAWRGNRDVVLVEKPAAIAAVATAQEALAAALDTWNARRGDPFVAIGLARQAVLLEPDSPAAREALLFAVDTLRGHARPEQALAMMEWARTTGRFEDIAIEMSYREAVLRVHAARRTNSSAAELQAVREEALSELLRLRLAKKHAAPDLNARVLIEEAALLGDLNRPREAIELLELLETGFTEENAPPSLRALGRVREARLLESIGLRAQANERRLDLLRMHPGEDEAREEAAQDLAESLAATGTTLDEAVLAMRALMARAADVPDARAAIRLKEGALFAAAGRVEDARDSLQAGIAIGDASPGLSALCAFRLAELETQLGNYTTAIDAYESVGEALRGRLFPQAPQFYDRAREGLVREHLAKARFEMRALDFPLAHATYKELLDREPRLPEAWRGYLESQYAAGWLDDAKIAALKREAESRRRDALAWYKYGYALATRVPVPKAAVAALERAIALDGSVPYYHQTLGYVLENRGREADDREMYAAALRRYERALALLDAAARPDDFADLLINAGNASFLLANNAKAMDFYRRRIEQGSPFTDPRREFLFWRSNGIALFRSGKSRLASQAFAEAGGMLPVLVNYGFMGNDEALERETELVDRQALALREDNDNEDAANLFLEVSTRHGEKTLSRVRAIRNAGFCFHRLSRQTEGAARENHRRRAVELLEQALALVTAKDLVDDTQRKPAGALFTFDKAMSAAVEGGSAEGFDRAGEERLIRAAIARLQLEGGATGDEMIAALRGQLESEPRLTDNNRGYYNAVRAVTDEELSREYQRAGRHQEAAAALLDALKAARFDIAGEPVLNANGLTVVLMRLVELVRVAPEVPFTTADLRATWLGEGTTGNHALAVLDECLERALSLRDAATGDPALLSATHRGRVLLARVLLAERQAAGGEGGGMSSVRAVVSSARVEALSRELRTLCLTATEGGELKRYAILADGARIRTAMRFGLTAEALDIIDEARDFASAQGFIGMRWWLTAQPALLGDSDEGRRAARAALAEIERLVPAQVGDDTTVAWELLDHLERLDVGALLAAGDAAKAWEVTERWRVARLHLLFDTAVPPSRTTDPFDAAWLDGALARRRAVRQAMRAWRNLPASGVTSRTIEAATRAVAAWNSHAEKGRSEGRASAMVLAPMASTLDDAMLLTLGGMAIPGNAALVLNTPAGARAWMEDGELPLSNEADWEALRGRAAAWFVMGSPLPDSAHPAGAVANMLTFESTLAAMAEGRFAAADDVRDWPGPVDAEGKDATPPGDWFAGATGARLSRPVLAARGEPFSWFVGDTARPVVEMLAALPLVDRVEAGLEHPPRSSDAEKRAKAEALALAFSMASPVEARVDGATWIGALFGAKDLPEAANNELDASIGQVIAYLDSAEPSRALPPAKRIWSIRHALGKGPDELAEAGLLLAQMEGDLKRYGDAAATSLTVVEARRTQDNPAELARALRLYASYAADAKLYEESRAAYDEAAALYRAAGSRADERDMTARAGVALENSGAYREALERYIAVGAMAEADGDLSAQCDQLTRIGRVHLHRLAEYSRARDAFGSALRIAEGAGMEAQAIQSTLDLARVDERLGRYDDAVEKCRAMEARAAASGAQSLVADAQLLRAFVEWARADYAEAYKAQRAGLQSAQQAGDSALQIIAFNYAGLISWTLNDTREALSSYGRALSIARDSVFRTEVASTLNNRGLVRRSQGDWGAALADFGEAERIDAAEKNRWGRAYALRNIGITRTMMGEPSAAIAPLEEASSEARAIGDRTNAAKATLALGDARRELGEDAAAQAHYEAALAEARAIPLPEVEWRALHGLSLLARNAGDADEAIARLKEGVAVIERLRARIKVEELQDGFLIDKQSLYDELVTLLLDRGQVVDAFNYSERSRGRNFIDLLGNARLDFASAADTEALAEERRLRSAVEEAEKAAGAALTPAEKDAAALLLDAARDDYAAFLIDLRANNPQLSNFVEVPPVDLAEVQQILDPGVRLLEYHVGAEETTAWVVGRDSISVARIRVTRDELAARLSAYRQRLQNLDEIGAETAILSEWLITPVAGALAGAERLCVVPHRELNLMPFAALTLAGSPLITSFPIYYVPSSGLLRYTVARRPIAGAELPVLAIGNPDLGNDSFNLPFAQKEAERLSWSFPDAKVLTGPEASESWVSSNIERYGIVHIAAHGEYDPDRPLLSAILLAQGGDNDGQLTAQEVFGLSIKADLVALSACQSGLGKLSAGDDIIGLNRAFVYAGTRQMLSSLWRVDDVSTSVLVKHFYRRIDLTDRADALRQAQLETRKRFPHPAHWAGMFLSGDWM